MKRLRDCIPFTSRKAVGEKIIEIILKKIEEANKYVNVYKMPDKCVAYIPDLKVYRVGVISRVPSEYNEEIEKEIKELLRIVGVRVERMLRKKNKNDNKVR